jgi:hypothetical protein
VVVRGVGDEDHVRSLNLLGRHRSSRVSGEEWVDEDPVAPSLDLESGSAPEVKARAQDA